MPTLKEKVRAYHAEQEKRLTRAIKRGAPPSVLRKVRADIDRKVAAFRRREERKVAGGSIRTCPAGCQGSVNGDERMTGDD